MEQGGPLAPPISKLSGGVAPPSDHVTKIILPPAATVRFVVYSLQRIENMGDE